MKKSIAFAMLLTAALSLAAVVANHLPPASFLPDRLTELRVEIIQGWNDISEAAIMYRVVGSEMFESVSMDREGIDNNWLKGYLPIMTVSANAYEYYFKFTLVNETIATLPAVKPDEFPYLLKPEGKIGELSPYFILLSTEAVVSRRDGYLFAVSWYALEGNIDLETLRVFVNGKDVTKNAAISANMLIYKDRSPKPGIVSSYVIAKTRDGKDIFSDTWSTVIRADGVPSRLPMNMRGSINAGSNVYVLTDDSNPNKFGSDRDDGWANLEVNADYEKLKLRSQAYLSTLQNEDVQNVNRFRLGVLLPFWEIYVGDHSPALSSLSLSGKNVRGVYSNLRSEHFELSFVHGETVRKVDGEELVNPVTKEIEYSAGTFKQEVIASRMQFGSEKGLIMGFTTTRSRDIVSSLDERYVLNYAENDTTQMVFPIDNIVFSMDTKISIPKANFVIGAEAAGSLYNSNTYFGPLDKDGIEDYLGLAEDEEALFNPAYFQDIFVINTNMQPLPLFDDLSGLTSVLAWQAYLRSFFYNNLLNISVSQVGASFNSAGTNNKQQDVTRILVSDMFNIRQRWFLSGGFSLTKDNMSKTKIGTNTYDNIFVSSMLRIPTLPYLSASYTNNRGKSELNKELEVDALTLDAIYSPFERSSNSISFGVGYEFTMMPVAPTTLDIGWRTSANEEKREGSSKAMEKVYEYQTDNFSIGLTSRFTEIPLKTQIAISTGSQDDAVDDNTLNNFNLMLKGNYRLMDDKISPWAELKSTFLSGDQDKQAYNFLTFGVSSNPLTLTNVSTSLGWRFYSNYDTEDKDYTTTTWRLNISQRF